MEPLQFNDTKTDQKSFRYNPFGINGVEGGTLDTEHPQIRTWPAIQTYEILAK